MYVRLIAWIVSVVLVLVGLGYLYVRGHKAGFVERDLACRAEIAAIDQQRMEAERQATAAREAGRALADKLAAQAAAHQAAMAAQSRRMHDEIDRVARAGRVALDAGLTRMLNERAIVRERVAGGDQAGTAGADAARAGATAAADPDRSAGGASERSVARWVVTASEMYSICRGRLHALQAWAREVSQ